MATIGKVSAVFTASTSGLTSGVKKAANSFRQLGGDAGALTRSMEKLEAIKLGSLYDVGPAAEAAGRMFDQFNGKAQQLHDQLQTGAITQEQYRDAMAAMAREVDVAAQIMERGAAVTQEFRTAEEKHARSMEELTALLDAGAISTATYGRAVAAADGALADATGVTAEAERAAREMQATQAQGVAVTRQMMTAEERHAAELEDLNRLLSVGAIDQKTYDRAVAAAAAKMKQADTAADGMGRSVKAASDSVSGITSRLNVLIGINVAQLFGSIASSVGNAFRSLVDFGRAEADVIDRTSKLAERTGMTYGQFAGIALAGELAGVGMDTVAMAATKADVAFVKASRGSKEAAAKFEALGLSVADLEAMSPDERFQAIAAAISQLPTEAEQAAAAVALFGRSGAELLPMFQDGAGAIAEARDQAERLGIALTSAQGQDVEAMNDAFTLAYQAVKGVVGQVVAYLSPAVKAVADTFTNLVGSIGGANIGQAIGDGILQGARFLAGIGDWLITNLSGVWTYVSQVGGQWATVFDLGYRVGQAFVGAFKLFEFVGNTIGGAISDIVSMLLGAAADTASLIPGFGDVAAGLRGAADYMAEQADGYLAAANENLAASGTAFANAVSESAPGFGQAVAGPLTTALDSAIAQAEASAAQVEESGKKAGEDIGDAVESISNPQPVKGIDSRSSEGVAEMFRLMRGEGADIQEQQLGVLEEIRDELSTPDDSLEVLF